MSCINSSCATNVTQGTMVGGGLGCGLTTAAIALVAGWLLLAVIFNAAGLTTGFSEPGLSNCVTFLKYAGIAAGAAAGLAIISAIALACIKKN